MIHRLYHLTTNLHYNEGLSIIIDTIETQALKPNAGRSLVPSFADQLYSNHIADGQVGEDLQE